MTLTQQIGLVLVIVCGSGAILYGLYEMWRQWLLKEFRDDWPGFVERTRITAQDSREREDRRWTLGQ